MQPYAFSVKTLISVCTSVSVFSWNQSSRPPGQGATGETSHIDQRLLDPHIVALAQERVRDYMMKIKRLEAEASGEGVRLNKSAADRFIKHAMAGDEDDSTPATKKAKKTKAKADKEKGDKSKTKKKGSKKQKKGKKGQDA
eukprot:TRINITY_DN10697_c0_g2_i1.p1 TRINITY_DN10697_c0_g2~~TRINITY_DN10697_c0_g2_i1.p1  ORF type:complete len:141 (+),score=26.17 TRINITY_DN10697_c0_g2_i1:410-832(+)